MEAVSEGRGEGEGEGYDAGNGLWHLARATIDSHINPNIFANLPLLGRIFMEQKDNVCGKAREAGRRGRRVVDRGGGRGVARAGLTNSLIPAVGKFSN